MNATLILTGPQDVAAIARRAEVKSCAFCSAAFTRDRRYSRAYFAKQKFCSQNCSARSFSENNAAIYGDPIARFMERVSKRESGCWEWNGNLNNKGYGYFSIGGKKRLAHRFALENLGSGIRKGQVACHDCDNPKCVNPEHLYAGTFKSNSIDAVRRGRLKHQKLSVEDAKNILVSDEAYTVLAERYGIGTEMVSAIKTGRKWAHLRSDD